MEAEPDLEDFPASFTPSQKGTLLLVDDDNYRYRIHEKNVDGTIGTYRCILRQSMMCPALAKLDLNKKRIVKFIHSHIHSSQLLLETARAQEKKMICAAAAVGSASTAVVAARIKANLERGDNPEASTYMRKTKALKTAIHREKKKMLGCTGKEPSSVEDIKEKLLERYKKTTTGGLFLRYCEYLNDEEPIKKLIMVFMSDHGAWVMGHATDIFMDGTFDTRPKHFAQIYFIRAKMEDKCCVPVAYVLLPNKETATYRKMWEVLTSLITFQPGLPQRVMSDFEKAASNTLQHTFPAATHSGCFFHFKQAVYRNLQEKGLESFNNQSTAFQYLVHLLYSLAMVPANRVAEYYDTVVQDYVESKAEDEGFVYHQEEISSFLTYYERTWLGIIAGRNKTRRPPLNAIPWWNKYDAVVGGHQLTNNTCEGANSAWAASIGPQPSLYVVLDKFIHSESLAKKTLREESLAVGKDNQANHSRTLAAEQKRQDRKALCQDFENVEPSMYMDSLVCFV